MSNPHVPEIAQALVNARRTHQPTDATPFVDQLQSAADAYAVQRQVWRELLGAEPLAASAPAATAWKSGGPSRTSDLTHAALLPAGILKSGANVNAWSFNIRIVEIEIALRLGRAVTPAEALTLTVESGRALVDALTVSIELVDSRWLQAGAAQPLLKLADLQSHGALVLGDWVPYSAEFLGHDWTRQSASLQIGHQPAVNFVGSHTLQDPTWLIPIWLRHATSQGQTVSAGTVVTTGSWCGMPLAQKGDLVVADFAGIGRTTVQL